MKLVTKSLAQLKRWKEKQPEPDLIAEAKKAEKSALKEFLQQKHKPSPKNLICECKHTFSRHNYKTGCDQDECKCTQFVVDRIEERKIVLKAKKKKLPFRKQAYLWFGSFFIPNGSEEEKLTAEESLLLEKLAYDEFRHDLQQGGFGGIREDPFSEYPGSEHRDRVYAYRKADDEFVAHDREGYSLSREGTDDTSDFVGKDSQGYFLR